MIRLREIRQSKGLKQSQLADAIGVSKATISGYESGKFNPGSFTMKALTEYLGVTMDDLYSDEPYVEPAEEDHPCDQVEGKQFPNKSPKSQFAVTYTLNGSTAEEINNTLQQGYRIILSEGFENNLLIIYEEK